MKNLSSTKNLLLKSVITFSFFFLHFSISLIAQPVFYGTTQQGGAAANGTIFAYNAKTGAFEFLYNTTSLGRQPHGSLTLSSNGLLYGVTLETLTPNYFFSFNPSTRTYSALVTPSLSSGAFQAADGNFYGYGQNSNYPYYGAFFQINPTTNTETQLFAFTNTGGSYPGNINFGGGIGTVMQATDGNLYGLTEEGGSGGGFGTMFKYNYTTQTFTHLFNFGGTNGSAPNCTPMQASDGNLYGMTTTGGTNSLGTIFNYNITTNTFTSLVNFTGTSGLYLGNAAGSALNIPDGTIIQASNGLLYGSTPAGGTNGDGTIFSYNISTGAFITLVNLSGTSGSYPGSIPEAAMIQGSDGLLYGTTASGGTNNDGTIFSYNISTGAFVNLLNFAGTTAPFYGSNVSSPLVTAPCIPMNPGVVVTNVTCNGANNGIAQASPSGGLPSFLYSWSTGATTAGISTLAPGTYSVTVTDFAGCTAMESVTITQPLSPLGITIASVTPACNGSNGTATANAATGGTAPYTYSWSGGGGNSLTATLSAGTYTITAKDNNQCTASTTAIITQPSQLGVTIPAVTNNSSCIGGNGSATSSPSGGALPYTYFWNDPANQTAPTATGLSAGTYSVTVTDNCGSIVTASATISQTASTLGITISSESDASCNGGTGSATASANGGTGALTYSWNDANSTIGATLSAVAGTYTVTAIDANGCFATISVTISQPSALGVTNSETVNVLCNGASTGSASSAASGGTSPYTYFWYPSGGSNPTASGLSAGTYKITVSDNCGSYVIAFATITQPANPVTASTTVSANESCNGGNTGSANVSAIGGTSPYTYSWSDGNLTSSMNNNSAGTYTVTVTDNNGCTASATATITQPLVALTANASVTANVLCNNNNTGSAISTPSGGTSPYTYSWSDGNLTSSMGSKSAGTYTITVTDNIGCTASASATITQPANSLSLSTFSSNVSCNEANDGTASVTASGGTPIASSTIYIIGGNNNSGVYATNYAYNSVTNTYATEAPLPTAEASGGTATVGNIIYYIGGGGSLYYNTNYAYNTSTNTWATEAPIPTACVDGGVVAVGNIIYCIGGLSNGGTILANNYAYNTTNNTWTTLAPMPTVNYGFAAVAVGNIIYCISGYNGSGFVTSNYAYNTITNTWTTEASIPAFTGGGCCGAGFQGSFSAAVGNIIYITGGYNDGLLNSTNFAYNTTTNTWTSEASIPIVCFGGSGCSAGNVVYCIGGYNFSNNWLANNTAYNTITNTWTTEAPLPVGLSGVSAVVGSPVYTYSWSNGATTSFVSGLSAGSYNVTVTDANGCTGTAFATLTQPTALGLTIGSVNNISCNGQTGTATANAATGGTYPYTYSWSAGGGTNLTATNISAGTYTITATDANGCTGSASATITQPPVLGITISSVTNASCNGQTGTATANTPTGGTSPYTYSWSGNGGTNLTSSQLHAGTYTITVKDNCGATANSIATITQPSAALSVASSFSAIYVNCYGGSTGYLSVAPVGGTTPYTYSWSTGATSSSISNLVAGTYTLTATDAHGCTASGSVSIAQPSALGITIASVNNISIYGGTGTATANTATNGTAPYTYSWSGGGGTNLATIPLAAGTYTITVKDNCGGTANAAATITQPNSPLGITISSVTNISCNGQTGTATANAATGGTSPYTYSWSGGGGTNLTTVSLSAGTYTITATDNVGATATASATITQPLSALTANASVTANVLCNGTNTGAAQSVPGGGTSPYTYSWSDGNLTSSMNNKSAGTYTVTVTDNHGCTASATATITQPLVSLTANASVTANVLCNGNSTGATQSVPGGGTSPYTYSWSDGNTASSMNNKSAGTYTVTVTDNNGCTATASVTITQSSSLQFVASSGPLVQTFPYTGAVQSWIVPSGVTEITIAASGGGGGDGVNTSVAGYGASFTGICTVIPTHTLSIVAGEMGQVDDIDGGGGGGGTFVWDAGNTTTPILVAAGGGGGTTSRNGAGGGTDLTTNTTTTNGTGNAAGGTGGSGGSGGLPGGAGGGAGWLSNGQDGGSGTGGNDRTHSFTGGGTNSSPPNGGYGGGGGEGGSGAGGGGGGGGGGYNGGGGGINIHPGGGGGSYLNGTVIITPQSNNMGNGSVTITYSSVDQNVTCYNGNNGIATAPAVTGGTSAYTYSWSSNGGSGNMATGLSAGTYTVTVTDKLGCTATTSATITQPASGLGISVSSVANVSCNGGTGSLTASIANGGTAPYTYFWSPIGGTSVSATGLSAGTYTITVFDNQGCNVSVSATITQPLAALTATVNVTANELCNGNSTGSVTSTPSGGTAPYTYSWSDGNLTSSMSNKLAGTYTVTVTDNNGCTTSVSATITQPTALGITISSVSNVSCNGGTGTATARAATGGTSPYTYSWNGSGGAALTTVSLAAGTYTITVTDNHGCTASVSATINQPAGALAVNASVTANVSCNGGNNGATQSVPTGGTSPYTYSWSDGNLTSSMSNKSAGTYTIKVTDNHGCTASGSITIEQPITLTPVISPSGPTTFCQGGNVTLSTNNAIELNGVNQYVSLPNMVSTATKFTFETWIYWEGPSTNAWQRIMDFGNSTSVYMFMTPYSTNSNYPRFAITLGGNTNEQQINTTTSLTTNTWHHIAVTLNGATGTMYFDGNVVGTNTSMTENPSSLGATTNNWLGRSQFSGDPYLNGTEDEVRIWNVARTQSQIQADMHKGLPADTIGLVAYYKMDAASGTTVADQTGNGYTGTTVNSPAWVTSTAPVNDYSSYSWSNSGTTSSITVSTSNTYSVTVTDADGCTGTASISVTEEVINANATVTNNVSCHSGNNGSAQSAPNGGTLPYTYSWSTGAITSSISSLPSGTYTVTVHDNIGCSGTGSVTITQPANAITVSASETNSNVCYGTTASATAIANGGTGALTYTWNDGTTGATYTQASGIVSGTYTVTVNDVNGCSQTASVTITEPANAITVSASETNSNVCYGTTASATAIANGGTGALTYTWNDGTTGATYTQASGIVSGTYTVTVNDVNGCSQTASVTITEPSNPITVTASETTSGVCYGASASATATANGGTGTLTYTWNDGITGATYTQASGIVSGTYTVTVNDVNGCSQTASVTITEPATAITVSANETNSNVCYGTTASATAIANGGTGALTYTWNDGTTGATYTQASGIVSGTYTVTVNDVNGCSQTASVTITEPANAITVSASETNSNVCYGTSASATATANGGTGALTYTWNDGTTGATYTQASGIVSGTYTVTVNDVNGCSQTASVTITEPATAITVSASETNSNICYGTTASATAIANGGTGALTYTWNDGTTGATYTQASGIVSGTYTVTVNDVNGCSQTASVTITEPSSPITVSANETTSGVCYGTSASATAVANGGSGALTYTWNDGTTGATYTQASGIVSGTYTVTVNDANGCSQTASVIIIEPANVISVTASETNSNVCYGTTAGATAVANGGSGALTYTWNDGTTGATYTQASGIVSGTYTVTVNDANGCSQTASVIITEPANAISVTASETNSNVCYGTTAGATAVANGGTGALTYTWNDGTTGATYTQASSIVSGTYTVTVNDANGCSQTASVIITEPANAITVTASETNSNVCYGTTAGATAVASGGSGALTYTWNDGTTGATYTQASGIVSGTYTVTVNDANGCSQTASVIIIEPANVISVTASETNSNVCYGTTAGATAVANGGSGALTYTWNDGTTGATYTQASGIVSGTYTVTVNDANGCSQTASVIITEPANAISVTASETNSNVCYGTTAGATAVANGGTGALTYTWNDGTTGATYTQAANITSGTYTVTVNDVNGCSQTASVTITEPSNPITVSASETTSGVCYGTSASATAVANGGTGTLIYTWNDGTTGTTYTQAANITSGTYTVTVNDVNGCSQTASVTITEPSSGLSISESISNVLCYGESNGNASISVSGGTTPYQYSWSNGGTTNSISGLIYGSYNITVIDANDCSVLAAISISQPGSLGVIISSVTNVSCNGGHGTITANAASGGSSPYTYSWSSGGGTNLSATLSAGTYTITVTDNHGCTAAVSAIIAQPASALGITISSITNVSCNGGHGTITANTATGGTSPYTYSWSGGCGTSLTATGSAGTYTITVTDKHGCTATAPAIITQPTSLGITISSVTNVSCNGGHGTITANTATGGTSPYTYSWSGGCGASLTATASAGTYTITVTDKHGCTAAVSAIITQPASALGITISSVTNVSCNGGHGTITANTSTGGTSPYTYSWSGGCGTSLTATGSAGTYTITVTDKHGCTATAPAIITQPTSLGITISSVTNVSCNGGHGTITANTATGGTSPYTYSWSGGCGASLTATASAGTYTITVTDKHGCTAAVSAIITQPASALGITISSVTNVSCNGGHGTITANTATGGTSPYTYSWSGGCGTSLIATGSAGTYTITVTDKHGCTAAVSAIITQPASALGITISSVTNVSCNGGHGTITANTATGGTSPYTYSWSGGCGTSLTATGSAGTYTITVTDKHGCTATVSAIITQPTSIALTATVVNLSDCQTNTGSASVTATGGTSPYTYLWGSNCGSKTTATVSGLSAGTYTVTVTDSHGCTAILSADITLTNVLRDSISSSSCLQNLITATVGVKGGISPYTYSWSPCGGTKSTITGLSAGTYTIKVTDKNGCSITLSAKLSCGVTAAPVKDTANGSSGNCCLGGIDNVNLYPNPTNGQFTVVGVKKGMFIEIYDYTGRKISVISANEETMQIDISSQVNGLYLMRITDKDGNLVSQKKVVKTK